MKTTLVIKGLECTVEYEYHRAWRGARERGTGVPLEPDEPESVEILSIHTAEDIFELFEDVMEDIEVQVLEDINSYDDDGYDRYRDDRDIAETR